MNLQQRLTWPLAHLDACIQLTEEVVFEGEISYRDRFVFYGKPKPGPKNLGRWILFSSRRLIR